MKTKDNLLKGIIIGVCVAVVPLLTTGLTLEEGEVGTFQVSTTNHYGSIFETIFNTKTGEVLSRSRYHSSEFKED